MEIKCNYKYSGLDYRCSILSSEIPKNVENVKFVGVHEVRQSNASVKIIYFYNCELQKIPENLSKIFPNLTELHIEKCKDLREIKKEDLKGLEKLKQFEIKECSLENLPGNLFEDMKYLEENSFSNNQIKFIGENLLHGLSLKYVNFYGNISINLIFYAKKRYGSTLTNIKKEIREKCAPNNFSLEILEHRVIEPKLQEENLLEKIAKSEEKLKISEEKLKILEEKLKNLEEKLKKKDEEVKQKEMLNKSMQKRQKELEKKLKKTKEIVDDFKKLADNENFKDIKVKVDDNEFKLHKFILAARSPTFAQFFTENPSVENLNLNNVSVEAFKIFIDYVYNNSFPQNKINSLEIFQMAGKLKVEKLKEFAAAKLMNKIDPKNAFEILLYANKYQHEELIQKSFEEVKKLYPTHQLNDELAKFPEKIRTLINAKGNVQGIFMILVQS